MYAIITLWLFCLAVLGNSTQLDRVEMRLIDMDRKISYIEGVLRAREEIWSKNIPPKFEKIGSRYFYIEKTQLKDWDSADSTCRQMGGYLASFQNQQELDAIQPKLEKSNSYWIGIRLSGYLFTRFESSASGQVAKFLKWEPEEPNRNYGHVILKDGEMSTMVPRLVLNFICQADNEV